MSENRKEKRIKLRKEEAVKRLRREEITKKINEVKNPRVNSIAFASLWIIFLVIVFTVGFLANELGVLWNMNTVSVVGIVISAIWVLTRFGVLEGAFYKYKKFRDKKIITKQHINVPMISREEYREYRAKKSWIGIILLFSIVTIIFTITLILQYT